MSNYDAGRLCGKLVKEALPKGGKIMIFIGRLEQDNAKLRRQGVIDEIAGRDQLGRRSAGVRGGGNIMADDTSSTLLEVEQSATQFPGVKALSGVDLTLAAGECCRTAKWRGCATLMKILAGVQPPDSGEIRIDGEAVQ